MTGAPPISAELALLAACDLASDEALARQVAASVGRAQALDWPRFAALAAGHQMAGLAGVRLQAVAPGAVPGDLADAFRRVLQRQTVMQVLQTETSARLTALFAGAGIRLIVLKGMALAHRLYPANPALRVSSDIDLLIDASDLTAADRVLRGAGYQRVWPEADLPDAGRDMVLFLANVFQYRCKATGQQIELHHRITVNPLWLPVSFDDLYAASEELGTGSGPIRGLAGPLLVQYLALHALGHHGFRLKWFCDLARVLALQGDSSCAACVGGAAIPLSPVPGGIIDGVLDAIRHGVAGQAGPVRRIMLDMEDPGELPTGRSLAGLADEMRFLWFQLRLSPGPMGKVMQVVQALSDSRDVAVLKLGRRHALLYAALGPLLALRRGLLRIGVGG